METALEVLTTRKSGCEVHRHWPDDVKAQIVSESLRPGALMNEVAERHGLKPCRTMARQGKLVLPAPRGRGGVRSGDCRATHFGAADQESQPSRDPRSSSALSYPSGDGRLAELG
jgi:transposase-like protein